jgi:hypothetical protein
MRDKRSRAYGSKTRSVARMVRPERIELPTSWFVAKHSIQLSYGRIVAELCLCIITETESFRPNRPLDTLAQKTQGELDSPSDSRPIPRWAVEIGGLAKIEDL